MPKGQGPIKFTGLLNVRKAVRPANGTSTPSSQAKRPMRRSRIGRFMATNIEARGPSQGANRCSVGTSSLLTCTEERRKGDGSGKEHRAQVKTQPQQGRHDDDGQPQAPRMHVTAEEARDEHG